MTLQTQKFITSLAVTVGVLGGFEALVYVLNLNETGLFVRLGVYIYLYLAVKMMLLYDLHFKNPGSLARATAKHESIPHWLTRTLRIWLSAFHDRFRHLMHWSDFRHFQNYLVLPALIYWGTVGIFFTTADLLPGQRIPLQQTFIFLSTAALVMCYWYLKEIFYRKSDAVHTSITKVLAVIKLYAAFLLYTSALAVARNFCLEDSLFVTGVFVLNFWLLYQAIFQHNFISAKSIVLALAISAVMALFSYVLYHTWGITDADYFTAGVFQVAWYNFFWGIFHHYLNKEKFNAKVFAELLLMTLLVSVMMLSVTNFKARILYSC